MGLREDPSSRERLTMSQLVSFTVPLFVIPLLAACGGEPNVRTKTPRLPVTSENKHDYGSTWVYTVGEVDSPTQADCAKALSYLEGDAECVGHACQRATSLVRDYQYACKKFATADERAKVQILSKEFAERAAKVTTPCLEKVENWLERGCGDDGACEARVQRWATQCSGSTKSRLIIHLLERLIENSLQEPRRVKLDTRSCTDFGKTVDEAARCDTPFACEDALPKVDEYVLRCAQGPSRAVELSTALNIVKIRMGAEKPIDPIALTDDTSVAPKLAVGLPLIDKSGAVLKVCGEPTTELKGYLEQRSRCKDGSVTLLRATATAEGRVLGLVTVPHLSDEQYQAAYPMLWVQGEADARAESALAVFSEAMKTLPELALEDFPNALAKVNIAYGNLPVALRQSQKLSRVLAPHDSALAPLFAIIASAKVSVAGTKLDSLVFSEFLRRSETLVFADLSKSGNIEIGERVDLSELLTKDALPVAFAAYEKGLEKLRKQALKRKLDSTVDVAAARARMAEESRACTTARNQYVEQQKQFEQCLMTTEGCPQERLHQLTTGLFAAKAAWQGARVREIIAKVSAGQPTIPSAVCGNL